MPGIFLQHNLSLKTPQLSEPQTSLVVDEIITESFCVNRAVHNKYLKEKLFLNEDNYCIVLDGIVTNSTELLLQFNITDWKELVVFLYKLKGETFFEIFRGSFIGVLYDKKRDQLFVFTDHIGSKLLYYMYYENGLIISSEMQWIYAWLKENEIPYEVDIDGAYMLLSYGFMLEDKTIIKGVRKLNAGQYLKIEKEKREIIQYHTLQETRMNKKDSENIETLVEELDKRFRKAVVRQFEKDKEYEYNSLVALSGGLDSRMTTWVAHDLGYKKQYNFTFSQGKYLDETIAQDIASDLGHEWIFKSLDNGVYLKLIEEVTQITGGNVLYSGMSHAYSFFKIINFEEFGMVHSGQLGDVIIGSFISSKDVDIKRISHEGAYSEGLLSKLTYKIDFSRFSNQEMFLLYQRAFNGANNGLVATYQFAETMSPFYDIDFMEYALSIPIEIRAKHNLYKQWIISKYPKAAEYIWEKTKRKITYSSKFEFKYKGNSIMIEDVPKLLKSKLGRPQYGYATKNNMNPFDYWYNTNSDLRSFMDEYFRNNIERAKNINKDLYDDLKKLYNGNGIEKTQVLSLLSILKLFF